MLGRDRLRALVLPYRVLLTLSAAWLAGNCVYVYLVLHGSRSYRIETAGFIFVALLIPSLSSTTRRTAEERDLSALQAAAICGVATAAWLGILGRQLWFPFLSDDYVFLDRYRTLGDILPQHVQFFRPLFNAVFIVLARVGGGSAVPFHVLALLIHLASAAFAHRLALRLFGRRAPAVVVFVVFLLNPLQLEAVLWIAGLQELLWTFFLLAALLCFVGAERLSPQRIVATLALLAAALLSKETAICFALVLPGADLVLFRMRRGARLRVAYLSFAALAVGYLVARSSLVSAVDAQLLAPPSTYFLKQFLAIPYRFFIQPWNTEVVQPPAIVPALLALAVTAGLFIAAAVRGSTLRVLSGPLLVIMATAPLVGYLYVGADLAGGRYLYMPALGWALLVAELVILCFAGRTALTVATGAIAAGLLLSLNLNMQPWRVAGDLVREMDAVARRGTEPLSVVPDWQARTGARLRLDGGVPRDYRGVGIFINGYPEFVRMTRGTAGAQRPR